MTLLAIDSFSSVLSIAVLKDGVFHCAHTEAAMRQSELVMTLTDNLLKEAGLKPEDLQGVLCMEGPGSFTGLRIGYSAAKGLALSLSIPFAAIPTFDCVAYGFKNDSNVLTIADARKNAWFYAFFSNGKRVCKDADGDYALIANDINSIMKNGNEKITLAGPGSSSFFNSVLNKQKERFVISQEKYIYAKELILTAKENNIFENDCSRYLVSGPEYLRKSDAELNS